MKATSVNKKGAQHGDPDAKTLTIRNPTRRVRNKGHFEATGALKQMSQQSAKNHLPNGRKPFDGQ